MTAQALGAAACHDSLQVSMRARSVSIQKTHDGHIVCAHVSHDALLKKGKKEKGTELKAPQIQKQWSGHGSDCNAQKCCPVACSSKILGRIKCVHAG